MSDVEETIKRIHGHPGVMGLLVMNEDGIPIKSTLDNATTVHYCNLIANLTHKARGVVRDIDPTNDLCFVRVRTKKHEIMIAPDKEFTLVVVQNPSTS